MRNLNLIYNKLYYSKLSEIDFTQLSSQKDREKKAAVADFTNDITNNWNKLLTKTEFHHDKDYIEMSQEIASTRFRMKTVYPGMLVGAGNPHGSHLSEADINMGFTFDYVTGQPCIPGSTVKGVLRSHFKDHAEVVTEILKQITEKDVDVKKLECEIFDGVDVFFDAVIYRGTPENRIIAFDYITPHRKKTKSPIPIQFIKILPDVVFEFRFKFNNNSHMISNEHKHKLFQILLELFGVGAKTNTGYGRLKPVE